MPQFIAPLAATSLALLLALPAFAQDTAEPAEGEAPAESAEGELSIPSGEATEAQATDSEAPVDATPDTTGLSRDTVVASVNDTDITLGQVIVAARQLPGEYQQLPPDILFGAVVDQLVQQELLAQTVTEEPAILEVLIDNQRRSLLANTAVEELFGTAVTEEALQAAYDATYAAAEPQTEWNAAHILVATEEEAQAVAERLAAGEDFAAVAAELSQDPGSATQGGELGWIPPGMTVPEFEAGLAALGAGEVSAPIQSQFGFHVIRLNESRPIAAPTLDEVRAELEGQVRQEAIDARLAELEAQGTVTRPEAGQFDPMLLGAGSLLED